MKKTDQPDVNETKYFERKIWEPKQHNRKVVLSNNIKQELLGIKEGLGTEIHLESLKVWFERFIFIHDRLAQRLENAYKRQNLLNRWEQGKTLRKKYQKVFGNDFEDSNCTNKRRKSITCLKAAGYFPKKRKDVAKELEA